MTEQSSLTDFFVQGHTAEGAPYGPVYILSVDEEGRVVFDTSLQHTEIFSQDMPWKDIPRLAL